MKTHTKKINLDRKALIEIIILAAAALACILYIALREKGDIRYTLPSFKELTAEDFSRLEISKPGGEILTLERDGSEWIILEDGYPADTGKTRRVLAILESVKPVDMVSQAGRPERYDLDETKRITLKGYKNENLIREIHAGKTSASGNYTYVLFPGDKNIYTLRGSLAGVLDIPPEEFRSKTVLSFDRNEITRIQYTLGQTSGTLIKNAQEEWVDQNGKVLETPEISDLLARTSNLLCSSFLESLPESAETSAGILRLTLGGKEDYALTIYPVLEETVSPDGPGSQDCPARSSGHPRPFLLPSYTAEQIRNFFGSLEGV